MSGQLNNQMRLVLTGKARLRFDRVREETVLLLPERIVKLNATGAAILRLCDGLCTVQEIISELEGRFEQSGLEPDVLAFLQDVIGKGWVEVKDSAG